VQFAIAIPQTPGVFPHIADTKIRTALGCVVCQHFLDIFWLVAAHRSNTQRVAVSFGKAPDKTFFNSTKIEIDGITLD
jgi:hypothetical protein